MKKFLVLPVLAIGLNGCGIPAATLGMSAASALFSGTGLLAGAAPAVSISQEFADVEAITLLVHKHDMTILAIEQSPVVTTVPMPVVVTPGTTLTPPTVVVAPTGSGLPTSPTGR